MVLYFQYYITLFNVLLAHLWWAYFILAIVSVRTKGYSTDLLDPTQVESKKCSQIQWPVPSINAEPVDIFLGEE